MRRGSGEGAGSDGPPIVDRPLFLLDYDGTLAPIVSDPARAFPHPRVPELLTVLCRRYPLLVITGRRVVDVARLLPVPNLGVRGVHGSEAGRLDERGVLREVDSEVQGQELTELAARVPKLPGLRLEPKGAALAIHYRGVPDEALVESSLRSWVLDLPAGLETMWGKKLLEVRLPGFDKGRTARRFVAANPGRTPVVIGDDTTDEDAFKALPDAVTVKVGAGSTSARYRLADVAAVVDYLGGYA